MEGLQIKEKTVPVFCSTTVVHNSFSAPQHESSVEHVSDEHIPSCGVLMSVAESTPTEPAQHFYT